jgi:hypothetical protein
MLKVEGFFSHEWLELSRIFCKGRMSFGFKVEGFWVKG